VGRELAGHIEVRQLAGVGAMGRVYRAFQKGIDRDVAVKILHRELSANAQLVARFHREAKVASRLLHPNVVQVHLAGQLPDGALYIVMEYLDGLSLQSAFAAAGGAVPLARALHIALQICDAVGEAHAQWIVHRDLKPENVMLVHRGEDADFVKVLDFGIARLDWGEQSMATAAGLIFGTARYISPEGAQGEQVGPQGDVYSIATLVYQMLSGRTPFEGDQAVGLLVQQIHDTPPPLKLIARSSYVPDAVANVVMAGLAKDKAQRVPDARAFGRALLEAAKTAGLSAEDLVARSSLLGNRPSMVQLASMQRTRQLQLDKPITEIAPANEAAPRTAYETPADALARPPQEKTLGMPNAANRPSAAPVLPSTQKLVLSPSTRDLMNGRQSHVDTTLDDAHSISAPLLAGAPPTSQTAPLAASHALRPAGVPAYGRSPEPPSPTAFDESTDLPLPSGGPPRGRTAAIVVLCFLLSVAVSSAVAYRMKLLGGSAPVSRPTVSAPLTAPSAYVPTQPALPPPPVALAVLADAGLAVPSPRAPVTATGPYRTALDATPAKPRLGQEVSLVAKVTTSAGTPVKKTLEDPHFSIAGSSIGGDGLVQLPAFTEDGTIFRANFTFLAPGKYEIGFHAKADALVLKASRTLVTVDSQPQAAPAAVPPAAGEPGAPPSPVPASPPAPAPAPSSGVKWL
jgi:serine/threonine-protein kinase